MNLHNAQRLKDINPACKFYRQPHFCRKILQTKSILILSLQQDLCGASRRWVVRPQSPKVDFFYPLDLIVVVSYFLVVDWCLVFGKNGRCVFKNIGKDCLFRPLSLSLFATMVQATRGQVAFLLLSLNCGLQRGADSGDVDFLTSSLFSEESIFYIKIKTALRKCCFASGKKFG